VISAVAHSIRAEAFGLIRIRMFPSSIFRFSCTLFRLPAAVPQPSTAHNRLVYRNVPIRPFDMSATVRYTPSGDIWL
jgi:hypothetical protein